MAASKPTAKKVILTRKRAVTAAKRARENYKVRSAKKPRAWEKGGKQWARVLGHFGLSA